MSKPDSLTITWEDHVIDGQSVGRHLVVRAPGYTTGTLCSDEALGCIASFIYGVGMPHYLQPILQHALNSRKWRSPLAQDEKDALDAAGEPHIEPPKPIAGFLAYEGQEPRT
jgi:hypothetical protein